MSPKQRARQKIERCLQLSILNLCLAASAGRTGDIALAKAMLIDQVQDLMERAAFAVGEATEKLARESSFPKEA